MGGSSFDGDRKLLKEALLRALRTEAGDPVPEPAIFREVAEAFDRQNGADKPEIPDSEALAPIYGAQPPLALIFFDTPGLQDYVFKVQSPIDILGGSEQVADFTRQDQDPGGSPRLSLFSRLKNSPPRLPVQLVTIYAGAGSGLLLVAASEAESTVAAIEAILREETAGDLETRAAALILWPHELAALPSSLPCADALLPAGLAPPASPASRYAAALAALLGRHQRERSRRQVWPTAMGAQEQFSRCWACGDRPGTTPRVRGDDAEQLCQPCQNRWRYGRAKRQDEPRTFEELLEGLDPPVGSLALIYADGANAGELFSRLDTPARHLALSRAVEKALEAAAQAVKRKLAQIFPAEREGSLRFQTAIQGGDDLVMIVPARGALELGAELIAAFEASIDEDAQSAAFALAPGELKTALSHFGLGVGIAVGEMHFPVEFLLDYARELLKNAKKLTRRNGNTAPRARSALDFLVLRGGTPLAASISKLREKHQETDELRFHRRPLCKPDLDLLIRSTRALRRVPPAQVQAIRRELPLGRQLSLSLWRYQQARSEGWKAWRAELGLSLEQVDASLWRRGEKKWETDFLDQIDARELVVHSDREAAS